MSQEHQCPQCGKALVENAPQGLCPACLLKRALQTETSAGIGGASAAADTTPFAPPTPADLAPHFPELEILELLGYGGMGVVYKARQKRLNRLVALKILSPRIGKEPAFAERFAREAQALARLNHPHIVTVHDFGQSGELFYFVMEYVEGVNLRQLLNAGRIAPREALAIVPQICEALQFAHDSGVVHRDIKPENILLDKKGTVKIADFGLAKLMGAAEPASRSFHTPVSSLEHTLTQPGAVMGTPQYMAPEQTEHPDAVDHRADIYSLGVVFYQMLTGELPIGRFAVPSKKVVIDVRLDEVVLRALEKEPALRYQHASDVKTEIETIATTPQSSLLQQAEYDVPKQRENISQRPLLQKAEFDKWQWAYWVALIAVAIGGLLWLLDKTGVFHLTPAYAEASLVVAFLVSFVIVRIVLATLRRVQHASDLKAEVEATVATPRVSGESAAQGPAAPATGTRPKISMSWVSTPEHLRTFRGRFLYIYQGKGELCLDRETLSFRSGWQSVTIPLSSIRSLAQGMYPASAKPLPLHYIAVIFTEHGVSRTLLFTPVRTEVMSNKVAMEWLSAMQEAIEACTGRTLPITVQDACWGGRAKSFLLTMVTVTLGFAVIPMIREHRWPHLLSELLFGPITTICLFGFVYMVEIAKRRRDRQASDVKTKVKTIAGTPSILNSGMSAQPKTAWEAWKAWLWPPLVRQRDGRRFIHWPALALRTLRAMTAILVGGLALFEVVTVEGPASKAPLVAAIYVGVAVLLVGLKLTIALLRGFAMPVEQLPPLDAPVSLTAGNTTSRAPTAETGGAAMKPPAGIHIDTDLTFELRKGHEPLRWQFKKNIPIVGVRNGRRAIHWPGMTLCLLVIATCILFMAWIPERIVNTTGILQCFFLGVAIIAAAIFAAVGGVIIEQFRKPLDQLASLDSPEAPLENATPDPQALQSARRQVNGPAIGLLITGILNWVLITLAAIVVTLLMASALPAFEMHAPLTPAQRILWEIYSSGKAAVIGIPLIVLAISSLMIFAALRMKRLQSHGTAMLASVLAILVSPGNLIGLPIGIWALVVLNQREVKAAFAVRRPPSGDVPVDGRGLASAVIFLTAVLLGAFGFFVYTVPHAVERFHEMGVHLPALTALIVSLALAIQTYGILVLPPLFAANLAICYLANRLGGRRLLRIWSLFVLLSLGVVLLIAAVSLRLPVLHDADDRLAPTAPSVTRTIKQSMQEFTASKLAAENRLLGGTAVIVDGRDVIKIENTSDQPLQLNLFQVERPPVTAERYALTGEIKYENVQGEGYLEMWNYFPTGQYFTRTLGTAGSGAMEKIAGTSRWREFSLPFDRTGVSEAPSRLELNIFLPGRGVVYLGPVKLVQGAKTGEDPETNMHSATAGQTMAGLPPAVINTQPASGARDVAPGLTVIRATFSKDMLDRSWSWSSAWEDSTPAIIGQPWYEPNHRTAAITVQLEPGKTYAFWLNSEKFMNFKDQSDHPAVPYLLIFQTKVASKE